jgi:predicted RNA-binding Zn-ribbon protein involved in translation (DUF1610 family)
MPAIQLRGMLRTGSGVSVSGPEGIHWAMLDICEIDLWPPLLPLIAVLFFLYWRRWRFRREEAPLCRHCGYNLTGNVSGICPECGATIEEKPVSCSTGS